MPAHSKVSPSAKSAAFARRLTWDELDPAYLRQLIILAREEDLSGAGLDRPVTPGDVTTSALVGSSPARADFTARQPLPVCGLPLLPLIFESFGRGCVLKNTPAIR